MPQRKRLREIDRGDDHLRHGLIPTVGDVVEGQPEGLRFAGGELAHLAADDGHALTQNRVPIRIVEDADDGDAIEHAVAGVSDVAGDLDQLLSGQALMRLHVGIGDLKEAVVDIGARVASQRRRRGWRLLRESVQVEQPGRARDYDEHDGDVGGRISGPPWP